VVGDELTALLTRVAELAGAPTGHTDTSRAGP
jgi:hypothetical protein